MQQEEVGIARDARFRHDARPRLGLRTTDCRAFRDGRAARSAHAEPLLTNARRWLGRRTNSMHLFFSIARDRLVVRERALSICGLQVAELTSRC